MLMSETRVQPLHALRPKDPLLCFFLIWESDQTSSARPPTNA
jgi:hypothetical protein